MNSREVACRSGGSAASAGSLFFRQYICVSAFLSGSLSHGFRGGLGGASSGRRTRIISSPIWQIQSQGMKISFSRPRIPQNFAGPGTIKAVMRPVQQSNSTSAGQPMEQQEQMSITSFCFRSMRRMEKSFFSSI